jgi:hypothetical protein
MTIVGASHYVPARPVGERCSHAVIVHDGRPDNKWCFEIDELREEMDALMHNRLDPNLTWAQHKDYWESLKRLVHRAEKGVLRITERPDAEAKVVGQIILELRPLLAVGDRLVFGRRPRRLRLYYGEPDARPHCLLALHLDTKEASEDGLAEQDEAIAESLRRANAWASAA